MILFNILKLVLFGIAIITLILSIPVFIIMFNDKNLRYKPIKDMPIGAFMTFLVWIASIYILTNFLRNTSLLDY
jgi:hypothetical protein